MRRSLVRAVSLVLVLFSISSCSEASSVKKSIIGKWIASNETVEFVSDGIVIVVERGKSQAGNYKFLPDGRLKMDFGIASMVFEVSIDKDGTLNLKEPSGKVSRYLTEKAYKAQLEAQRKAEDERKRAEEEKMEKMRSNFAFSELTIQDKSTGLMWTRDAHVAGKGMTIPDALNLMKQLNEQRYAGYSDWRLPEKAELETLPNFAKGKGVVRDIDNFLNKLGFRNVTAGSYWSATRGPSGGYWWVRMSDGYAYGNHQHFFFNDVWPVRTGR